MHSLIKDKYRREVSEQKAWRSCLAHEQGHMLCTPYALLCKPHDPQNTSVPTVNQLQGFRERNTGHCYIGKTVTRTHPPSPSLRFLTDERSPPDLASLTWAAGLILLAFCPPPQEAGRTLDCQRLPALAGCRRVYSNMTSWETSAALVFHGLSHCSLSWCS